MPKGYYESLLYNHKKISHSLLSNKEYFKKNQKYYLYLQIKNKYQIAEDFI